MFIKLINNYYKIIFLFLFTALTASASSSSTTNKLFSIPLSDYSCLMQLKLQPLDSTKNVHELKAECKQRMNEWSAG